MRRLFRIYNRLTDVSDHEYKFMVKNKSKYIDKARVFVRMLDSQDVHLERLPDYDNSNEPDTGSSYPLAWSTNSTVYDPISEDTWKDRVRSKGNPAWWSEGCGMVETVGLLIICWSFC